MEGITGRSIVEGDYRLVDHWKGLQVSPSLEGITGQSIIGGDYRSDNHSRGLQLSRSYEGITGYYVERLKCWVVKQSMCFLFCSCVSCPAGYEGYHCQREINECESQPCLNDADCVDKFLEYSCDCNPGFNGKFRNAFCKFLFFKRKETLNFIFYFKF